MYTGLALAYVTEAGLDRDDDKYNVVRASACITVSHLKYELEIVISTLQV